MNDYKYQDSMNHDFMKCPGILWGCRGGCLYYKSKRKERYGIAGFNGPWRQKTIATKFRLSLKVKIFTFLLRKSRLPFSEFDSRGKEPSRFSPLKLGSDPFLVKDRGIFEVDEGGLRMGKWPCRSKSDSWPTWGVTTRWGRSDRIDFAKSRIYSSKKIGSVHLALQTGHGKSRLRGHYPSGGPGWNIRGLLIVESRSNLTQKLTYHVG